VQENGSATFNLTGSFLQILWGSPDPAGAGSVPEPNPTDASRNFIQFFSEEDGGGDLIDTITAKEILDSTSPDFTAASAGSGYAWVKIALEDNEVFKSITAFNSGNNALELDGAVVPLPAAAWLMIGGLGAVGAYARRSRKAASTA